MNKKNIIRRIVDDSKSIIIAVIVALIFRSLLFEPFHIPSGSMKPNLEIGNYIVVSKYSYGYSRYSFPFNIKLFNGRIGFTDPQRGDVVVFKLPNDPSINYVKRLIGLPGDKIQIKNGIVYLNNHKICKNYVGEYKDKDNGMLYPKYEECIKNGIEVLDTNISSLEDNTDIYTVPDDHYFFLGDNRDNSKDSRFLDDVGYIHKDYLVGKAKIKIFPEGFSRFWVLYSSID